MVAFNSSCLLTRWPGAPPWLPPPWALLQPLLSWHYSFPSDGMYKSGCIIHPPWSIIQVSLLSLWSCWTDQPSKTFPCPYGPLASHSAHLRPSLRPCYISFHFLKIRHPPWSSVAFLWLFFACCFRSYGLCISACLLWAHSVKGQLSDQQLLSSYRYGKTRACVWVWSMYLVSVRETEVLFGLGNDVLTAECETIQEHLKLPFKRGQSKSYCPA